MENFIVSARKYRPQNFSTVVGQSHITTTLKNAIRNNQLAHAFLFCGPRGVGKTTCARILAKTINCENLQPDGEACNQCHSCVSFNEGSSFNIHELDAASNNSVDDIRTLVEQVRFAPQAGKYKIYIIDEVHMLSSSAFNAFLKTLEEPPSYAIFILATTEKHKILPTILSRCQIFDFKRITIQDTVEHLQEICQKEHIQAENDALHLVAQKTDGCMRDSLSTLDKIVSFTGGKLTYQNTLEHLNILDYDYFFKIMDGVLQQDVASALLIFDEILQKGFEGDNFLNGWAEFLRNLLLCKEDKVLHLVEVSGNLKDRYRQLSGKLSPSYLITALHLLNETEINYRMARNKRLHVELALIKLCFLQQAVTLVSDDQTGEVVKKKLVADGSAPQKLRAPIAQATPAKAGQPATSTSIAADEPKLSIENKVPVQSTGVQQGLNTAAQQTGYTQTGTTQSVSSQAGYNQSGSSQSGSAQNGTTHAGSSQSGTSHYDTSQSGSSHTSSKPAATVPKVSGLAAMKQAFAAQQTVETRQESIPMTHGALSVYWDEFIDRFRQANKMTVVSNLQLAVIAMLGAEEIGITSRNIVQFRFMEEEKLHISQFFKDKFRNNSLVLTLHLDESQQTADIGPAPLSSREKFAKMIEKYPLVKELKDKLNLELDF
ncbi:DNA polymerase III subunit gamma/tau [Chitinophaga sancti]|uniref:DNA polymerase III subunit gamma/tau n=1 Tax=Chitinophaga sancti TaxID=1004 RepID=A0A1K1PET9_9BACT|nr:DNA polymerase III subunit gamma/tau [Chitinophaga sancti]WQD65845.1 DNA polymerase III subunit gamma/tau [Chitinophaga sancti]WQG88533.1 DNA polymerase III subunit gamma/tau [Chitinophaga sancti]SFW46288.1 DNA polymerase-3 subunit gamma/tau [Chitinophaga sancti]